jgi:Flp pilus assembly protein TadD
MSGHRLATIGTVLLVSWSAGAAPWSQPGHEEWVRGIEAAGLSPKQVVDPFETTPEMAAWVEDVLAHVGRRDDVARLTAIQDALFADDFGFQYEVDLTLTAAQAFARRRGNCMSFTVLFASLARIAGVDVFLASVMRDPDVDREADLVVLNRHVVAAYSSAPGTLRIFDFYIRDSGPRIRRRVIDDVTATAMYHSNLGGDAIRSGRLDQARDHLDIATSLAPDWAPAWINLGVVRNRLGDAVGAMDAYRRALEADPLNASALSNMAAVYRTQGLDREADTALRAAAHQTTNPFTLIALADAEMLRGRYGAAGRWLRKAKTWYPQEPEVFLALARLATQRGRPERAARHRDRAEDLATNEAP